MILHKKARRGFTLIEMVIVIGIVAVLLAITLVALNPARQFAQANNTKRASDVTAILNAIHQYMADPANAGAAPIGIDTTVRTITNSGAANTVDLCAVLVTDYLADLPVDPKTGEKNPDDSLCSDAGATYDTKYTVVRSLTDNRITVTAPDTELQPSTPIITITR